MKLTETCPRCCSEWGKIDTTTFNANSYNQTVSRLKCTNCALFSTQAAGDPECYAISLGTYMINWNMEKKTSLVLKGGSIEEIVKNNSDENAVELPLLPFDTTLEKLKTLLIFI